MNETIHSIKKIAVGVTFILCFIGHLRTANAWSEVSCWDNDCLKNGWTWLNVGSGLKTDIACYRDGCASSGWIAHNNSQKYYTQCKGDGCFKQGWYRIDQNTQSLIHNVICRSKDSVSTDTDCFKYGWVVYGPAGQEAVMSCFHNDCYNQGWLIQTSYELIRVNCKSGGCWSAGWIEN
jgi:hypothetical protein